MEVVDPTTDNKVRSRCKNVERHLRLALSDWYHLLSSLSLSSETWLYDCEWWMKNVPSQLDMPWAFESLEQAIKRPKMLEMLEIKVDEVCMSMDRTENVDFPKSMYELRESLKSLREEVTNV